MDERLCLMTVHAHPDDESSKGPGTVARYRALGVRTVLVSCTGGEEGDVLNPAMDCPEVREHLAEVRRAELDAAASVIGYDRVVRLGYRDSGMPGSEANARPEAFANVPLHDAVGRLVAEIRLERPQVVIAYPEDQRGYPHPDHLRVHEVAREAFWAAGDPDAYPELGEAWGPSRLWASIWARGWVEGMHAKFVELGIESPYSPERLARAAEQPAPDAIVSIEGFADRRRLALLEHRTQIDPASKYWFGLPPEVADAIYPFEEYQLVAWRGERPGNGEVVDDLFAGLACLETLAGR